MPRSAPAAPCLLEQKLNEMLGEATTLADEINARGSMVRGKLQANTLRVSVQSD